MGILVGLTSVEYALILAAVAVVVVAWLTMRRFGVIAPRGARAVIRIRGGEIHVAEGAIGPLAREHLQALVGQFGIRRGMVAITAGRKVVFSASIPKPARQPIRNVLLNM